MSCSNDRDDCSWQLVGEFVLRLKKCSHCSGRFKWQIRLITDLNRARHSGSGPLRSTSFGVGSSPCQCARSTLPDSAPIPSNSCQCSTSLARNHRKYSGDTASMKTIPAPPLGYWRANERTSECSVLPNRSERREWDSPISGSHPAPAPPDIAGSTAPRCCQRSDERADSVPGKAAKHSSQPPRGKGP
jgi:hypothetical protein